MDNSLLVEMIADYMRQNGRGLVFSDAIEKQIGRPYGQGMPQTPEAMQRYQSIVDALIQQNRKPAPINNGAGIVRG